MVARFLDTEEVASSNLASPTIEKPLVTLGVLLFSQSSDSGAYRAFTSLDEAFPSGAIEATNVDSGGQVIFREPEADYDVSVTVTSRGDLWVADAYHYEIPLSMCQEPVD